MHACMHTPGGNIREKISYLLESGLNYPNFAPIKPRGGFSFFISKIEKIAAFTDRYGKKKKKKSKEMAFCFFPSWFNDPHSRKRGEKAVDARWPGWTTFSSHRLSAPPPSPAGSSSPYARLALPWCPNVADANVMCHSVFLFLFSLSLFPISFLFSFPFFLFISFAITTTRNNWNEP